MVGLGNPGDEYAGTRHNVGFDVADRLAQRWGGGAAGWKGKFRSLFWQGEWKGRRVILAKPQTYMNLSGQSVREVSSFYAVPRDRMLVAYDDFHLPLGCLRLRPQGTAGGHNGVQSVIECLATPDFPRLRIGIGPVDRGSPVDFVLGRFRPWERERLEPALDAACDAVECWLDQGIDKAMTRFNATGDQEGRSGDA